MTLCGTCGVALGTGRCVSCLAGAYFASISPSTVPGTLTVSFPTPAPRPELPRELAAEPIVAWRCWYADPGGLLLPMGKGQAFQRTWATRDATARCDRCTYLFGTPPGLNCSCGLYASKEAVPVAGSRTMPGCAWGKVALYGKVIEHERGYRAQHARILELHTDDPILAALLRLNYGVPVTASPPAPRSDLPFTGKPVPQPVYSNALSNALNFLANVAEPPKRRRDGAALAASLVSVAFAGFYVSLALSGTAPAAISFPFALAHAFAAGCYATLYLRPRP